MKGPMPCTKSSNSMSSRLIRRAFFYDMTYAAKVFEINFDICTDGSVRIILFSDYPRDSFSVRVSSTKGSSSLLYFKQTGTGRLIDGVIRKCFELLGQIRKIRDSLIQQFRC